MNLNIGKKQALKMYNQILRQLCNFMKFGSKIILIEYFAFPL